ncbi:MAG TPA: SOS response-associated peptidase [Chthonomonadales bacterium]|nr:SOS response-associated peptidase [Chthonomonadales bacterium]
MCGRFVLSVSADEVASAFQVAMPIPIAPRYNIAPSQAVLCVREPVSGRREAAPLQWGLVPGWSRDPTIGSRLINARAETAAEKPSFRGALRYRRCLVPSNGYFEWKPVPGGRKQPHLFRMRDGEVFGIAGLWEQWEGPDGYLETLAILTTDANELTRPIHNRMPVIVPRAGHALWLDPTVRAGADVLSLLRPYPSQAMTAHPVGYGVNSPANDSPDLVVPLAV